MSRGFNMWNYMTYHLVHDYFKAKKKKKTEIQNFEVKNYKAAQKAAEQWIKSVRKFAESSYGVHYPKELYYGATQVPQADGNAPAMYRVVPSGDCMPTMSICSASHPSLRAR